MKLTKSKLKEMIREEIQKLNEGFGSPELMGEKDLAKFEKTRQKNAEVLVWMKSKLSNILYVFLWFVKHQKYKLSNKEKDFKN